MGRLGSDPLSVAKPADRVYDVVIVGAGVVGCALACRLSRYQLRVAVLEKCLDVGEGTSKANSAIIHTGFDATPGTLEARLVTRASRDWPALAARLKVPFARLSAVLLALDETEAAALPKLRDKAVANGVDDVELITARRVRELEPDVCDDVRAGLLVHRESVIDPFTVSIAFAQVAAANGVDFLFDTELIAVEHPDEVEKVLVDQRGGRVRGRILVNAAGLGSRRVAEACAADAFDINPRRGQFLVFDRDLRSRVNRILLPVPTAQTKGKLVTPTIFGNLLAGPTAEDLAPGQDHATDTTPDGLAEVMKAAVRFCPFLGERRPIASYAGLRCHCAQGTYRIVVNDGHPGVVTVTGVRSTGLTSSPALADHLVEQMVEHCDLSLVPDPGAIDGRAERDWPGWWRPAYDDRRAVDADRDAARIVCYCEDVSRADIRAALASPVCPPTLDALKRRTRAMTGRCQAFNCGTPVAALVADHGGMRLEEVGKSDGGGKRRSDEATERRRGEMTERDAAAVRQSAGGPGQHHTVERVRVAVVGAGPAGMGVAVGLARRGIAPVVLIDRAAQAGGVPAHYAASSGGVPTFVDARRGRIVFGARYADRLLHAVRRAGTRPMPDTQVLAIDAAARTLRVLGPEIGCAQVVADAIVLATGAREMTAAERGDVSGTRPGGVYHTMQLLQWLDHRHGAAGSMVPSAPAGPGAPGRRPLVLGSDLIAWAVAARLMAAGAEDVMMADTTPRPRCSRFGRLWFRRWVRPVWHGAVPHVRIIGGRQVEAVAFGDASPVPRDMVVLSGRLVPQSELLVAGGLAVRPPFNLPVVAPGQALTMPGWFVAGNALGGFRGAAWCYRNGLRTAGAVARHLRRGAPSRGDARAGS